MRKDIDINKVDWSKPYYENMRSPSKEKLSVTFSKVDYEFVDIWNKRVKDGDMVIVPMRDGSTLYLETDLTKADQHYIAAAFRNQRWSRYLNVTKTWIAILLVPPIILLILGWALLWVARGFKQEKPIFKGWERAGNVPELVAFIDKPPPLPQTSQPKRKLSLWRAALLGALFMLIVRLIETAAGGNLRSFFPPLNAPGIAWFIGYLIPGVIIFVIIAYITNLRRSKGY
jgi:hypothetical protein